jgi:hypothetical protein
MQRFVELETMADRLMESAADFERQVMTLASQHMTLTMIETI